MSSKKTKIGFLLYGFDSDYSLQILPGITDCCFENNAENMIFFAKSKYSQSDPFEYQYYEITQFINSNTLDGLVVLSTQQCSYCGYERFFEFLKTLSPLPIVSIGVEFPDIPSIVVKTEDAFGVLLQHLIDVHGCKRIVMVSTKEIAPDIEAREITYRKIMERNKIAFDSSLIYHMSYDPRDISETFKKYKCKDDIDFDAVCFMSDRLAAGFLDYCNRIGVKVPEDLIVVGFDDADIALLANPPVTTVTQHLYRQGYESVRIMLELLRGNKVPPVKYLPSQTIYRKSCSCVDINFSFEAEKKQTAISLKYLKVKEEILALQSFLSSIHTAESSLNFCRNLKKQFESFDVNFCVISLYDEPIINEYNSSTVMPDSVHLFLGYNTESGWFDDTGNIHYNPYESLLPPNLDFNLPSEVVVITLFNASVAYGYAIFSIGSVDWVLYPLMFSIVANELSSVILLENTKNEQMRLMQKNDVLQTLSRTDELTGLLNRRGLMLEGQERINQIVKENDSFGLIIYGDMDGLKTINDTYGHKEGDVAIRGEAEVLKKALGKNTLIARLGGDEFTMIVEGKTLEDFQEIKQIVEELTCEWNKKNHREWNLSISLGASALDKKHCKLAKLLNEADSNQYSEKMKKKMYAGKRIKKDDKNDDDIEELEVLEEV